MSRRYKEEGQEITSSPESDSNKSNSVTGPKKRPSRAGTRSVSTLSAAQLERKRANDREAQRAIRQRTKEHIEKLERRIAELTSHEEPNDQLVQALRRNKELEEENALLRMKLEHANIPVGVSEGGMRVGSSWDETVANRQHLQGETIHQIGQQQIPSMITSPTGEGSRATNPFAYHSTSHWQNSSPFSPNPPPKGESTTTAAAEVSSEEFSAWAMDRRRFSSAEGPPSVQQMEYPHMFSSQSQSSAGRSGSPISYGQIHEGHQQHVQQHQRTPGLSGPSQMGDYPVGGSRQQQQYLPPSQQQQPPAPPSQQHPSQRPSQHYQFHQPPQAQPGQLPPRTQHEQQPVYYGAYSQA